LIEFTNGTDAATTEAFVDVAREMGMQLKSVVLKDEEHAHKIWGSNLTLIRADGHVAWRGQQAPDRDAVREILEVVTGQKGFPGYVPAKSRVINIEGMLDSSESSSETEILPLGESV
jgi:FAD-dependent monooxygenase